MPSGSASRSTLSWVIGGIVLSALVGCGGSAVAPVVAAAAPAAGSARIWFYRDYEPSVSRNMANVALNGAPAVSIAPDRGAVYRDVAPGRYHVTVESFGTDVNQDGDVDLAAGQEAFVKILAQNSWENGGDINAFQRDTFYVALVPAQVAQAELAAQR
jgi:hypothetical protein